MKVKKKNDLVGDRLKYLRGNQNPTHNLPLEKRKPKVLPSALLKYMSSSLQIKKVKLQTSARGRGTKDNYNRIFLNIEDFLSVFGDNLLDLDQDKLTEYLDHIDEECLGYNFVKLVKPAVIFLELSLGLKNLWSSQLQKMFDGVLARAACEKKPVKKANCLPLAVLEKILHHYITPHLDRPQDVSFLYFYFKFLKFSFSHNS